MRMLGKILWYSARDKNGIIKDSIGNEWYFDISVCKNPVELSSGKIVSFYHNESIKECLCAHKVHVK